MAHASVNIRRTGSERESSKISANDFHEFIIKRALFVLFCFFKQVEPLPGTIYSSKRFPAKLYLKMLKTVEKSTTSN